MSRPVSRALGFTAAVGTALVLLIAGGVATAAAPSTATPSTTTPSTATPSTATPAPAATFALGAYAAGPVTSAGTPLTGLESQLRTSVAVASSFRGWGDLFPDPTQLADSATGHTLLVAWDLGATSATRFSTFTSHQHDSYLTQEAAAAVAYGKPFYIRPWAEMNGDWTAFQPTPAGDRPAGGSYAQFIAAWRYVVTFFRGHGASNVRWVFNPTADTYAGTTPVSSIWPGRAYVDVLGLDGYNWGSGGQFAWRGFSDIFTAQYARLTALDPGLPVWVCETGSKEPLEDDGAPVDPAHSKAAWYQGMGSWLVGKRVRAVVLFDARKERDWRVSSDPAALDVVRRVAAAALKSVPAVGPAPSVQATVSVRETATVRAHVRARASIRAVGRSWVGYGAASVQVRSSVVVTITSLGLTAEAARASATATARAKARTAATARAGSLARSRARATAASRARQAASARARAAILAARR
ncbi:MAG: hypothetical protein JWO57_215 [Pseudonocardiales bacterium]|nr:hypothetical protein [Pseudonocardiales bacterium]